jgi:hypothetical protein
MSEFAQAQQKIAASKGKKGEAALADLKRADDLLEVALATDPSNAGIFASMGSCFAYVLFNVAASL